MDWDASGGHAEAVRCAADRDQDILEDAGEQNIGRQRCGVIGAEVLVEAGWLGLNNIAKRNRRRYTRSRVSPRKPGLRSRRHQRCTGCQYGQ